MTRLLLGFVALISLAAPTAQGCSCFRLGDGPVNARSEMAAFDAVFVGKVADLQDITLPAKPGWPSEMRQSVTLVTFHVKNSWKGVSDPQVLLFTGIGRGGPDCSFEFQLGKEYLVFAQRGVPFVPGELNVTKCSETKLAEAAHVSLRQLGRPRKQFPNR